MLRYVPMAARYDGEQHLVENYNTVTITPFSIAHLSEKPDVSSLSAVAMGVSRKYEDDLNSLPSVLDELDDTVKDSQVAGADGVLPGTILLNGQFTEVSMENQENSQHPVVHIASHFVFKPGDDNQSYLLLAGKDKDSQGFHLTVADFRDDTNLILTNSDLLKLSACETGTGGNVSSGREVDGLGMTVQRKGAKAVISSLWEVDGNSAGDLMAKVYRRWAHGGNVTKVEALRPDDLEDLHGDCPTALSRAEIALVCRCCVTDSGHGIVNAGWCRAVLNSRNMFHRAVQRHLNPGIRRAVCTQIPDRN